MANTIGKFIKYWKTIFDHIDSKVNFIIPENIVSYQWINGRQNDKNLELNQNNFRLQIGKMDKKDETIYTKEILLPAIEYILKKTWKSEKALIQLRPDLARFLTNEDQKEESKQILSFEEEKQKIIQLIKKYFKNKEKNIEIINISKQYPEIFSLLKEKWKDWLFSAEKPLLNKKWFSPLDFAKYLYWISQHNTKFMNLLYNTKTEKQKKLDTLPIWENQSDYYSLVEISIRLYEVLSWISIQWWIDRQSKYDRIIWWILERKDIDPFKIKDYAELQELHNFCKEVNPDFVFERLRISTKDAEKVWEKKQTISKFKTTSLIASVALMSVLAWWFGWYQLSQNKQKKEKQKLEEKLSYEDLNKTDISFWWLNTKYSPWENIDKKQEYLRDVANNMFNQFKEVYGTPKDRQEDIISVIKNELLRIYDTYELSDGEIKEGRNIERFYRTPLDRSIIYMKDFLIKTLVPNNKLTLNQLGCNVVPYNRFLQYKSDFEKTLSTKWDLTIRSNTAYWDLIDNNSTWLSLKEKFIWWWYVIIKWGYEKKNIWTYYDYHNYNYYYFIEMKTIDWQKIILASKDHSPFLDLSQDNQFSLENAKEWIQKIQKYREDKKK